MAKPKKKHRKLTRSQLSSMENAVYKARKDAADARHREKEYKKTIHTTIEAKVAKYRSRTRELDRLRYRAVNDSLACRSLLTMALHNSDGWEQEAADFLKMPVQEREMNTSKYVPVHYWLLLAALSAVVIILFVLEVSSGC
jgi:hypothetical protein